MRQRIYSNFFTRASLLILVLCIAALNARAQTALPVQWMYSPLYAVNSVAYSPDGTLLAVGGVGGIQIRNASSGALLNCLPTATSQVTAVTFSPDGGMLADGGNGADSNGVCVAELWNLSTGKLIFSFNTAANATVSSVAFSPDGKTLADGGVNYNASTRVETGVLEMWNVSTGNLVNSLATAAADGVNSVAFSPDGTTLADGGQKNLSSGGSGVLEMWAVQSGKLISTLGTAAFNVNSVAFSPNGMTLADCGSIGDPGTAYGLAEMWNVTTSALIGTIGTPENGYFSSVAFSPSGTLLAIGGSTLALYNASTGTLVNSLATAATVGVSSVAFSPDGTTLADGGDGSTLSVSYGAIETTSVSTGAPITDVYSSTLNAVGAVAFSPDGGTVAVFSGIASLGPSILSPVLDVGMLELWSASTGTLLQSLNTAATSIYSIAYSPDGKMLADGGQIDSGNLFGGVLELRNVPTGSNYQSLHTSANGSVLAVAFSPDGTTLAVGGVTASVNGNPTYGVLELWDVSTGTLISTLDTSAAIRGGSVKSVSFSPDGKTLAVGGVGLGAVLELWNVSTHQLIAELTTPAGTVSVNSVAFSPDGTMLAVGGDGAPGLAAVWNVSTESLLSRLSLVSGTKSVAAVAFSPDGNVLFAATPANLQAFSTSNFGLLDYYNQYAGYPIDDSSSQLAASPGGSQLALGIANGGLIVASNPYYTGPTISSFSPTQGEAGTTVTIMGGLFGGTTAVAFNGTPSMFTVVSASEITTTVPVGAASGPIKVTTPGGFATSEQTFTVLVCVANPQTVPVDHNTATPITLTGTSPDDRPLTFVITANPAKGTLSGLNTATGAITYTPNANCQGADSFMFTVTDGLSTSTPAIVTLKVAPGIPTANPQALAIAHNTAKSITLTGTDLDSPPLSLTFAIAASPTHGTLTGFSATTGAVTYTPNSNFGGMDSFRFTVNNGTNTSPPSTVTLNVAPGIPTANAQAVAVAHNTAKSITLTGTDPDNPPLPLKFAIKTSPAHGALGTLNTTTGVVTYTPSTNFQGKDSFTFTVNNGTNTSAPATVTLTVAPGTPTANPQSVSVAHNTAVKVTLTGTDPDSPPLPLTFALKASPAHGLITLNTSTGAVTYTPGATFQGTDSFTFTVNNGVNSSAPATVTLNVAAGTPTANPQTVSVVHNTATKITLTGTDSDSPALPLTFAIAAEPSHGSLGALNKTTGAVTYTPNTNFQGADSFTFTVSNGVNTSAAATVTLKVAAGTPTANPQTVAVAHNTATKITLTGSDSDSPALPLTFAIRTQPAHGTLSGLNTTTGAVTYTPGANKYGADSFTFTVSNGVNTSAPATVTINVAPGVPIANAQTVDVTENKAITITLTGTDPDSPPLPLTFAIAAGPTHGTLSGLNTTTGKVTYTPDANFHGTDSFTFTVSNGANKSAPAKVMLNIAGGG